MSTILPQEGFADMNGSETDCDLPSKLGNGMCVSIGMNGGNPTRYTAGSEPPQDLYNKTYIISCEFFQGKAGSIRGFPDALGTFPDSRIYDAGV